MNNQRGFTLVEMVIIVAILSVLAMIVTVSMGGILGKSRAEAYESTRKEVQAMANRFFARLDSPKFRGEHQFPIIGASKGELSFYSGDDGFVAGVLVNGIEGNPLGGISGGNPIWVDDGDGLRGTDEEVLNDEDSTGFEPGWHVQEVVFRGITYFVDSRDFFIDFDLAKELGAIRKVPKAAAPENCPRSPSKCGGSYIYFLNADNRVDTLLADFPAADRRGFQRVFP